MSNRSMVKLIHADTFFPPGDVEKYYNVIQGLNFVDKMYGKEIENFSMILPGMEPIMSKVLGERVKIDAARSGIFRKPLHTIVHFEEFDSLNEWCFVVALERTTLNMFHHLADRGRGEYGKVDAKTALDGWDFNYRNLFEWDIHTNVLLEPNQGVFFRPWCFHSLESGIVQYYRLLTDKKFRVLITGKPGSGRPELAQKISNLIPDSKLLKSKTIRETSKDIDFTYDGRMRHIHRMLTACQTSTEDCIIVDMVCPLPEMRTILNPDVIIWVDDDNLCTAEEAASSFVPLEEYDIRVTQITEDSINEIIRKIKTKRL